MKKLILAMLVLTSLSACTIIVNSENVNTQTNTEPTLFDLALGGK